MSKEPNPIGHFVLYAKGHYLESNTFDDLAQIARFIELPSDNESLVHQISTLAWQAISESEPSLNEFREMTMFLYTNKEEIIKKHAPDLLDDGGVYIRKMKRMLDEQFLAGLLVIIARWNTQVDLPEATNRCLPRRTPKIKKKKEV